MSPMTNEPKAATFVLRDAVAHQLALLDRPTAPPPQPEGYDDALPQGSRTFRRQVRTLLALTKEALSEEAPNHFLVGRVPACTSAATTARAMSRWCALQASADAEGWTELRDRFSSAAELAAILLHDYNGWTTNKEVGGVAETFVNAVHGLPGAQGAVRRLEAVS